MEQTWTVLSKIEEIVNDMERKILRKILLLLLLLLVVVVVVVVVVFLFSPWAGLGTDQSSVRRLIWLWYAASWASS